jgi:hypothetical protein
MWSILAIVAVLLACLGMLTWRRPSNESAVNREGAGKLANGRLNGEWAVQSEQLDPILDERRRPVEVQEQPSDAPYGTIRLVATLEGTGEFAEHVPIRIYPIPGSRFSKIIAETGPDGTLIAADLIPGRWAIDCLIGPVVTCSVEAGAETTVQLAIPKGRELVGIVVDEDYQPIQGAEIWLSKFSNVITETASALSDIGGRFRIGSVGHAEIFGARAAGYAPSPPLRLAAQVGEVEIVLLRNGASVSGQVSNAAGIPLCGALVELRPPASAAEAVGQMRTTSVRGDFTFSSVAEGACMLRVAASGYALAEKHFSIRAEDSIDLDIVLQNGGTIRGVIQSADGQYLPNVFVYYGDRSDPLCNWVRSGEDGSYVLEDVATGDVLLVAEGGERGRATQSLYCHGQCSLIWDPILGRGPEIAGVVIGANGKPGAGMRIVAILETTVYSTRTVYSTKSDHDGRFTIQDCAVGKYRVEVRDAGNLVVSLVEGIEPGGGDLTLRVREKTARIVGRIYNANGKPLSETRIIFSAIDRSASYPASTTAADGAFVSPALLAGSYRVIIDHPRYCLERVEIADLINNEERDLGRVDLRPAGSIRLELTKAQSSELDAYIYDPDGAILITQRVMARPLPVGIVVGKLPLVPLRVVILDKGVALSESWVTPSEGEPATVAITID